MAARFDQAHAGSSLQQLSHAFCHELVWVEDDGQSCAPARSNVPDCLRYRPKARSPGFPSVAGDEDLAGNILSRASRGEQGYLLQQRIDARVARNVDLTGYFFRAEVGRRDLSGREQKVGLAINRDAIFFLRPRQQRVVRSETRFDVSDRNASGKACERGSKRTGCVPLND
jgi:hypothetical protein